MVWRRSMARARTHGAEECDHCGAPRVPGLASCEYCRQPYPGAAPGPRCRPCDVVNLTGALACGRCRSPLARACLFCGAASPLDAAACVHCREAFAGAPERLAQREAAARSRRNAELLGVGIQTAGVVISSGAAEGFLDALAGLVDTITQD